MTAVKIEIPLWMQANALMLKLAHPLLQQWAITDCHDPVESDCYNAWFALRKIGELFLANRSTRLKTAEREMLVKALKFAHEFAHDSLPGDPPDVCDCSCRVAETIRDFVIVMADDAQQAREAIRAA